MPGARKVQANYEQLEQAASLFAQQSQQSQELMQTVSRLVGGLQNGGWVGQGAQTFFSEMEELVFPGISRLASGLQDASQATRRISETLQQAEEEAARLFQGDGNEGSEDASGSISSLFGAPESNLPTGRGVNAANYRNGVDGWSVLPGANAAFVAQDGPSCWLYGPMNAAIAAGYPITQAQADKIFGDYIHWHHNPLWRWQQEKVLEDVGADFSRHYFLDTEHGWAAIRFDQAAAEKFLIDNVKAGKPVMINSPSDNTFGIPNDSHTYTVVGVKTDANGKLASVLVSTNWASDPNFEIPAPSFMKDWGVEYGDSILVEPPAKP